MERMRQSIPLLGVNRAENDLTVKDGACERLHNLRFDAGAWRNVNAFRCIGEIVDSGGYKPIYKHPTTSTDLYIAIDTAGTLHEVRFTNGRFVPTQKIATNMSGLERVFSFGYVLIVVAGAEEHYFVLYGTEYVRFEMPSPPTIGSRNVRKKRFSKIDFYMRYYYENHDIKQEYVAGNDIARLPDYAPDGGYYYTRITDRANRTLLLPLVDGDWWFGAIAVMVAYRMMDGTVVSNSELMIFASDGGDNDTDPSLENVVADGMPSCVPEAYRTGIFFGSKTKLSPGHNDCYIQPEIDIVIPDGIDTRIVQSVAVYSTRIVPIYDFEKTWQNDWSLSGRGNDFFRSSSFQKIFSDDVDLLQEPLYRIKEIPIRDFANNRHTEILTYTSLVNAESLPVYEPTQSLHRQIAKCYYEYNGRLHKGNLRTRFFPGYSGFCDGTKGGSEITRLICTLDIENTRKQVCRTIPNFSVTKVHRVISYPDYRATRFAIWQERARTTLLDIQLEPSEGNNYAYAILPSTYNAKYPSFTLENLSINPVYSDLDDVIVESNRVQVSAQNNLFSLPFANSYRIGVKEERILAIATVVDELSATRFGAFPLYVFTDRGVWSLESGTGEILYSNILPVNHDKIINPNTCAALDTVFYITSRGVHALRGRSSQLISRELERSPGELGKYLTEARIFFQFKYGDLIVYNTSYIYAYVYSISMRVWSSRDMNGNVLNNDEIVSADTLATITDESQNGPVDCLARTRPLKLGTTDFKRLETVVARIMSRDCVVQVVIEGSNDCETWSLLRNTCSHVNNMDARLRRTTTSFRFFRLELHLTANYRSSATGVDVEYYPRFVGHLR